MTTHQIPAFAIPEPGDLTSVELAGRKLAVTVDDGQVYAFDDACTHAQCALSGGEVEDGAVICPCHFAAFELSTGEVRAGPAKDGLRCYRAQLHGDALVVGVDE